MHFFWPCGLLYHHVGPEAIPRCGACIVQEVTPRRGRSPTPRRAIKPSDADGAAGPSTSPSPMRRGQGRGGLAPRASPSPGPQPRTPRGGSKAAVKIPKKQYPIAPHTAGVSRATLAHRLETGLEDGIYKKPDTSRGTPRRRKGKESSSAQHTAGSD
jgi:hypothetical protein